MFRTNPPKLTTLRHSKLRPCKVLGETWLCFLPCFIGLYWFHLLLVANLWQFFVQCTMCTLSVFFHNTCPAGQPQRILLICILLLMSLLGFFRWWEYDHNEGLVKGFKVKM